MLKKIGLITMADVMTKGIGYLLLPVYLGLMSKEAFGQYGFLIGGLGSIGLLLSLSLYVPFIREFSKNTTKIEHQKIVSTIFISLFFWLILVTLALVLLKPYIVNIFIDFFAIKMFGDEIYLLSLLIIDTNVILLFVFALIVARRNTFELAVFTIFRFVSVSLLSIVFLYTALYSQDEVVNRMLGVIASELFVIAVYLFYIVKKYIHFSVDFELLKRHFQIALPLVPSGLIGFFMITIDRSLIAEYHGLSSLADYNLAMQALMPIEMLMSATQMVWSPYLFSVKNDIESLRQSLKVMFISLGVMILGVLFIYLLILYAIELNIIRGSFSLVPNIILMASVGVIANTLLNLNSNMYVRINKTKIQLMIGLLILLIYWALNIFLVPMYSVYGAAISSGIAYSVGLILGISILNKIININEKHAKL